MKRRAQLSVEFVIILGVLALLVLLMYVLWSDMGLTLVREHEALLAESYVISLAEYSLLAYQLEGSIPIHAFEPVDMYEIEVFSNISIVRMTYGAYGSVDMSLPVPVASFSGIPSFATYVNGTVVFT